LRQDYPELVAACSAGNLETARFLQEHGSENKIYVRGLAALLERLKAEEDARETALQLGRETDAEALCLPYGRGGLLAAGGVWLVPASLWAAPACVPVVAVD